MDYPFNIISREFDGGLLDNSILASRPFVKLSRSFQDDARRFIADDQLETAINAAIAIGEPLLITGESGTGKTQAAYYAAYKLNIEPVIHFQVKSDSVAKDLLYNFDTIRYFHDSYLYRFGAQATECDFKLKEKKMYVEKRALWHAFETAVNIGTPRVLLIDEIDKAPRDFPNDLLHELDKMEFHVTETDQTISVPPKLRPIVFITSNSERRLPEPFLRRCVYHHIRFNDKILDMAIKARRDDYAELSNEFLRMALQRFLSLRDRPLRKKPATSELLLWLNVLAFSLDTSPEKLDEDLSELPYLGVLLKDHQDIGDLTISGSLQD